MIFVNRFQTEWGDETAMEIRKITWTSPTKATMTGPVVVDPADPTLFWTYQEVPTNDCMPVETNGGKFGTAFVAFRLGSPKKATE